jgi:hypothetical protein
MTWLLEPANMLFIESVISFQKQTNVRSSYCRVQHSLQLLSSSIRYLKSIQLCRQYYAWLYVSAVLYRLHTACAPRLGGGGGRAAVPFRTSFLASRLPLRCVLFVVIYIFCPMLLRVHALCSDCDECNKCYSCCVFPMFYRNASLAVGEGLL